MTDSVTASPSRAVSASPRQRRIFLCLVVAGIALRLFISWISIGTNDARTFEMYADRFLERGLLRTYATSGPYFNHPPVGMEIIMLAGWISNHTGLRFPFVYRLGPIAADIGICMLLWKILYRRGGEKAAWLVATAYAWCLDAILISGYHNNADAMYVFFALLAVYFVEERRRFFWAGLALGAGINIKLIPFLLFFPLFTFCRTRQHITRFIGGLAIMSLPFVMPLLFTHGKFLKHVIGYNSETNLWGFTFLTYLLVPGVDPSLNVDLDPSHAAGHAPPLLLWYITHCKYFILSGAVLLSGFAWRQRRLRRPGWNAYELSFLTLALFHIITPNYAVQYTAAPIPFLMLVNMAAGTLYGFTIGLMSLSIYYLYGLAGSYPVESYFSSSFWPIESAWMGLFAWIMLICITCRTLRLRRIQP